MDCRDNSHYSMWVGYGKPKLYCKDLTDWCSILEDVRKNCPASCGNCGSSDEAAGTSGHVLWRFEDPFLSGAAWHTLRKLKNTGNKTSLEYDYTVMMGMSQNFQESTGEQNGVTKQMKSSAGSQIKKLSLGADHESGMLNEVSSGVTQAQSGTFTSTEMLSVSVEPGDCVELRQMKVVQDDLVTKVDGVEFLSYSVWLFPCDDDENMLTRRQLSLPQESERRILDQDTASQCPVGFYPFGKDGVLKNNKCCETEKDDNGVEWRHGGNQTQCLGEQRDCDTDWCVLYAACNDKTDCTDLTEGDGQCTSDDQCLLGLTCGKLCSEFDGRADWGVNSKCCYFDHEKDSGRYVEPAEGAALLIYNAGYERRFQRLAEGEDGAFGYSKGLIEGKELWIFQKPIGNPPADSWILVNAASGNRLSGRSTSIVSSYTDYDESYDFIRVFRAQAGGRTWQIQTADHGNGKAALLAMGGSDGTMAAPNTYWWQTTSKNHLAQWRFEDPYVSEAMWHTIRTLRNDWTEPINYDYTVLMGYSKNFASSSASSYKTTKQLKRSAGLSFKYLNLGHDREESATSEFSSGVTSAQSKNYTVTTRMRFTVPGNECVELRQLKVIQDDKVGRVDGMTYHSPSIWMFDCNQKQEGNGVNQQSDMLGVCRAGCSWDFDTGCRCDKTPTFLPLKATCLHNDEPWCSSSSRVDCTKSYYKDRCCTLCLSKGSSGTASQAAPLAGTEAPIEAEVNEAKSETNGEVVGDLHTIDEEYHLKESETETVLDKEEAWSRKERREKGEAFARANAVSTTSEGTPLAVHMFAGIGICAVMYGALRFYFPSTSPTTQGFVTIP